MNNSNPPPLKRQKKEADVRVPTTFEASLDGLPDVIRQKVLIEFIGDAGNDLVCLLRLAAVSRTWSKRVYGEVSVWKRIDFSGINPAARNGLTDRLLLALLRRVDAKNITEDISLRSCHRLKGRGIGPLRGSTVLRKLDLRFVPEQGSIASDIDLESLQRTLNGIVPFARGTAGTVTAGLQSIHLPEIRQSPDKQSRKIKLVYSKMIKSFHKSFVESKQRGTGSTLKCDKCREPKLKYFATDFVTFMAVRSICIQCDSNGPSCEFCSRMECSDWKVCSICEDLSCNFCKDSARALTCSHCGVAVGLNHTGEPWDREPPLSKCQGCRQILCSTCRTHARCSDCGLDFCSTCCTMARCDECDGQYCTDCSRMSSCGACGDTFCNSNKCENDHFKHCVSSSYRRSVF